MTREKALEKATDLAIFAIACWGIAFAIYGITRIDWLRAETIGVVFAAIYWLVGALFFYFAIGWIGRIIFRPHLFH